MAKFNFRNRVRHTRSNQADYVRANTPDLGGAEKWVYQPVPGGPGSSFLPMTLWGNSVPCGNILPRIFEKPLFVPGPAIAVTNFGGVPAGDFEIETLPPDEQYYQ